MCNYAVNWCDKLCFFAFYICCFIANFGFRKKLVNSRTVTEPNMTQQESCVIFLFLVTWPLRPRILNVGNTWGDLDL